MAIPFQIISLVLIAFFLIISETERGYTAFTENRSETPSEKDQGFSADEFTSRVTSQIRSGINRKVKFGNLYLYKRIYGSVASPAPVLKILSVRETPTRVALITLSTTVLRI
jgi:hypothetical protein